MADRRPMSERETLTAVQALAEDAAGAHDTELSKEREKIALYYGGERPLKQNKGSVSYVSQDVYEVVEEARGQLLEVFAGNQRNIEFTPQGADDVEKARVATEYCSYVVHRQNPGYFVFSDVIWDGLMARIGWAKVYWDENLTIDVIDVDEDTPEEMLYAMEAQDPTLFVEDGVLYQEHRDGRVVIEAVPPEEMLASTRAKNDEDADYLGHRMRVTRGDLITQGYDPKKVDMITGDTEHSEAERDARFKKTGSDTPTTTGANKMLEEVTVYESYPRLDIDRDGQLRRYRMVHAPNVVLEPAEEVDNHPFVSYTPIRRPHSLWGTSFAEKLIPTQDANTHLFRGVIDHTLRTNNPRWTVLRNTLDDPNELMENRMGGLVNVNKPDAIGALEQPSLNPFVFQTMKLADEKKEGISGISRLGQGLNKDAISSQNSTELINQMAQLSQGRQKISARNFAEGFLKQLYLKVYALVIEREDKQKVFEVAGNWVEISTESWKARTDVTTEFHVGYREQERAVGATWATYGRLASDPALAPGFTYPERRHLATKALALEGVKDVDVVLKPTNQIPPPEPTPEQKVQLALAEQQLELNEREMALKEGELQLNMQKAMNDAAQLEAKNRIQGAQKLDAHDLEERELEHQVWKDREEMKILASIRKAGGDARGIASP